MDSDDESVSLASPLTSKSGSVAVSPAAPRFGRALEARLAGSDAPGVEPDAHPGGDHAQAPTRGAAALEGPRAEAAMTEALVPALVPASSVMEHADSVSRLRAARSSPFTVLTMLLTVLAGYAC